MARHIFKLPDIGEGTLEAEIVKWHVAVGDPVAEDQLLVDVMTEKATVELTSPVAGTVVALHGEPGAMAAVGAPLAEFEIAGAGDVARPAPPAKVMAAPAVRRRAEELGIPLHLVSGSGPDGRILPKDLDAYAARPAGAAAPRPGIEDIKIVGLRRKIAERMAEAARRIPHFSYIEEIDVTPLEQLRRRLNDEFAGRREKLTILPFLMRALVKAAAEFPQVNAHFDDQAGIIRRFAALHIGIATQTAGGLMVPVVRHAESRDLWNAAAEITRLAQAARDGGAGRDELSGSTITISSLGALGGIAATPIINAPEVAIIGVNKLVERPMVKDGSVVIRSMMNLSSSFDHRVIDGWDAASFVQAVKARLEEPGTLIAD